MKRHLLQPYIIFIFLVLAFSKGAAGQSRWGIDGRPSLNFPTRLFLGNKLQPGFGFDAEVTYNFVRNAAAYAGWGWTLFPQNKTNGDALSVERLGSRFGLKITQPINRFNLAYFVKAGALNQHISVQKTTEKRYTSGQQWGWQIESGLSLPLDFGIALQPGIKYTNVKGHMNDYDNRSRSDFHLNDLSFGIILSITFGRRN